MSDTTALGPDIGGMEHIKLHATAAVQCPYRDSVFSQLKTFSAFNLAFQQATGWELDLRETIASYRNRVHMGDPAFPAASKVAIWDLSSLLPPGIPAVSRIYCEKLVHEFNRILEQLTESRQAIYESNQSADQQLPDPPLLSGFGSSDLAPLPTTQGVQGSNFSLTALYVDAARATCDWYVSSDQVTRFAVFYCVNQETNSTRELIAARSTFLTECRHESDNATIQEAIQDTVHQFFEGTGQFNVMVGSINSLTGDVDFAAGSDFRIDTSIPTKPHGICQDAIHLPRGHRIAISHWEQHEFKDEVQSWMDLTMNELKDGSPVDWPASFATRMTESIPSLPVKPSLAFAISR